MFQRPLPTQKKLEASSKDESAQTQKAPSYDLQMFWRIRWFFAITLTACNCTGIVCFFLTKNPYCLTSLLPDAFMLLIYYLVPMDEKRYQLKMAKIRAKAQVQIAKQEERDQKTAMKQDKSKKTSQTPPQ